MAGLATRPRRAGQRPRRLRRGIWQPPKAPRSRETEAEPTFHEFASEWFETRRHEFAPRTREVYELSLTRHLLPFFKDHLLSGITAQEADRYKAAKVREREERLAIRRIDLVAVEEMTGHSKLTTTERCLHSRPRPTDAATLTAIFSEDEEEQAA